MKNLFLSIFAVLLCGTNYAQSTPASAGMVSVTLEAGNVWGDSTGYQMLLDADANTVGRIFSLSIGRISNHCTIPDTLYNAFEYKIPANAEPKCTTENIVVNNSITIEIPAGKYDFCIANPVPGYMIYLATTGAKDDFLFELGKKYKFIVFRSGDKDSVQIVVENDNPAVPAAVSELTAMEGATPTKVVLKWVNPSQTHGGNPLTNLTAVKLYQKDSSQPAYLNANPVVGATDSCTIDVGNLGHYDFRVVAENSEGVSMDALATITLCPTNTLPYAQDFESQSDLGCWRNIKLSDVGGWAINSNANSGTHSMAQGPQGIGVRIKSALSTSAIEIPEGADPVLQLYSYIGFPTDYGSSAIYISKTDANFNSFTELHVLSGDDVKESWQQLSIPLGDDYAGETVYIAFVYEATWGHWWYVDDVKILDLNSYVDAALASINAPNSSSRLSANEEVKVSIANNGGQPLSDFQLKLERNGIEIVTETYDGSPIASMTNETYTFKQKLDLSAAGTDTLKVTVIAENDQDAGNDSKTKIVTNQACPFITSFPWTEDFSDGIPACWGNRDADNDQNKWRCDLAGYGEFALSESYIILIPDIWEYPATPDNWLITPPIKLDQQTYALQFGVGAADPDAPEEHYSVLVSTTGTNPEDFTEIYSDTLSADEVSEDGKNLTNVTLDLSAYSGKDIFIAFRHWNCTDQFMLILDDVSITVNTAIKDVFFSGRTAALPLNVWIADEKLQIGGLNIGERYTVYNISGQIVWQGIAESDVTSVVLNTHGTYIIHAGERRGKVVY